MSDKKGEWRKRSRKHRYMIIYDKSLKPLWKEQKYPKGDNDEYEIKDIEEGQMYIFDFMNPPEP